MASVLNHMENEGLIVVGRQVRHEWDSCDTVKAAAATVDEWARKLSLPLGLVYCGTTINWPGETPKYTAIVIGIITFSGFGDDDEPVAGTVQPSHMAIAQGAKIPDAFWSDVSTKHGVDLSGAPDVYVAAAGWTWVKLEGDGQKVSVSTEDRGCRVIPEELRGKTLTMKVGYC